MKDVSVSHLLCDAVEGVYQLSELMAVSLSEESVMFILVIAVLKHQVHIFSYILH